MNSRLTKILYILIPAILLVWLLGYEFFWRYDHGLDMTRRVKIFSHTGEQKILVVRQRSEDRVDTVRRIFADLKQSKVTCDLWIEGSTDTIHTSATGRYFSELRPTRIASDASTQVMLIPNSEHDLPTGWGELVYLTPSDSLRITQVINANITDREKDGTLELFDKTQGAWTKLDPATGRWISIETRSN
jgi:hypothetical protein